MKTGVTFTCPCGATDVPAGWDWTAYVHESGTAWSKGAAQRAHRRGTVCRGPGDLFTWMLRNAELAEAGPDLRLATDAEIEAGRYHGGDSDPRNDHEQNMRDYDEAMRKYRQGELF
ncbi:hypothetical protein ACIGKQ_03945 [Gordonia sp. NPDC062954]|uniref:hypothetical protein n=1 Tax=Gordonia sp. NPDC062954 TaxID=3364003 RepID=UPI0037C7C095